MEIEALISELQRFKQEYPNLTNDEILRLYQLKFLSDIVRVVKK